MERFIVMGVSGCGKTSVAHALARATGGSWFDADDFHPPANKSKMAAGIPLTDDDRWPWLELVGAELAARDGRQIPAFLACSALKKIYRDRLRELVPDVRLIHLKGSFELIHGRMAGRKNHFMPAALLQSQFSSLEEPGSDENPITLDISRPLNQLVSDALLPAGLKRSR